MTPTRTGDLANFILESFTLMAFSLALRSSRPLTQSAKVPSPPTEITLGRNEPLLFLSFNLSGQRLHGRVCVSL